MIPYCPPALISNRWGGCFCAPFPRLASLFTPKPKGSSLSFFRGGFRASCGFRHGTCIECEGCGWALGAGDPLIGAEPPAVLQPPEVLHFLSLYPSPLLVAFYRLWSRSAEHLQHATFICSLGKLTFQPAKILVSAPCGILLCGHRPSVLTSVPHVVNKHLILPSGPSMSAPRAQERLLTSC